MFTGDAPAERRPTKTTTFAPYHATTAERVSIADLAVGDIVAHEGALFEMVDRSIWTTNGSDRPIYSWRTRVLDASGWTGPAHWLNDWIIQGNSSATVARMAQGIDFEFIAAGQPGGVAARMHG